MQEPRAELGRGWVLVEASNGLESRVEDMGLLLPCSIKETQRDSPGTAYWAWSARCHIPAAMFINLPSHAHLQEAQMTVISSDSAGRACKTPMHFHRLMPSHLCGWRRKSRTRSSTAFQLAVHSVCCLYRSFHSFKLKRGIYFVWLPCFLSIPELFCSEPCPSSLLLCTSPMEKSVFWASQ